MMKTRVGVVVTLASCPLLSGFAQAGVTVRGIAYDSLNGRPLSGAFVAIAGSSRSTMSDVNGRFVFDTVAPGTYRFIMQHDVLDSIGMSGAATKAVVSDGRAPVQVSVPSFATLWRAACRTPPPPADSGLLFGSLHLSAGMKAAAGAAVTATWLAMEGGSGGGISQQRWRLEAVADSSGNYTLCGVPTTTGIRIQAIADSSATGFIDLLPLSRRRVIRRDLMLGLAGDAALKAGRGAVFTGRVLADTSQRPIANTEVSLPELGISGLTDDKGEFRLTAIIPGSHQVLVRRIGFGVLDTRIEFAENETLDRTIHLDRITLLDSVNVNAKAAPRDLPLEAFAEHKKRGFGTFLTRDELQKREGSSLPSVLVQMQGLAMVFGGGQAWAMGRLSGPAPRGCGKFGTRPINLQNQAEFERVRACWNREGWLLPDNAEDRQGLKPGCYAAVYVDRILMNPNGVPYSLNSMSPAQIEAIEWFSGSAQTPPEYTIRRSGCGVLVIHTRR